MTSLADRVIAALRSNHDQLAGLVPSLGEDQLTGGSGAAEWSAAQVLSHLGSGAEIGLATYRAAQAGEDPPAADFNETVWARWNAMTPREQADGFVEHNARLVAHLESLTAEQREALQVRLGFLPFPLPLAGVAGMRLSEAAQHTWDLRVAADPAAGLDPVAADLLVELYAGPLGFLLGFIAKADQLAGPARVRVPAAGVDLVIGESTGLVPLEGDADATLDAPAEALMRLLAGRLGPAYTPGDVTVTGAVTLEDLRRVFPGY
jgi:uncharacterized protein (TIGR03083 family)